MNTNGTPVLASRVVVPPPVEVGRIYQIPVARIRRFKDQPRKIFDRESLEKCARSLKIKQRHPIILKRIFDDPEHDFELIDGERRWRSAKIAGITHLDAIIKEVGNEIDQYIESAVCNLGREDHPPIEKARILQEIKDRTSMTTEEIADLCSLHPIYVTQLLGLRRLTPELKARMSPNPTTDARQIPLAIAIRIAPIPTYLQAEFADEIMERNMGTKEASFFIRKKRHQAGLPEKNRNPNKDYRIIVGFIKRTLLEARLLLDMPEPVFKKMFESRSGEELVALGQELRKLSGVVKELLDKTPSGKK